MSRPPGKRKIIRILNPAPDGSAFTTPKRAARFVTAGRACFTSPNTLLIIRDEREKLRLEAAWRLRESRIDTAISGAMRYGQVSWSGGRRRNIPWWERNAMPAIPPGCVVS